jgi:hypothetical protein
MKRQYEDDDDDEDDIENYEEEREPKRKRSMSSSRMLDDSHVNLAIDSGGDEGGDGVRQQDEETGSELNNGEVSLIHSSRETTSSSTATMARPHGP